MFESFKNNWCALEGNIFFFLSKFAINCAIVSFKKKYQLQPIIMQLSLDKALYHYYYYNLKVYHKKLIKLRF